MRFAIGLCTAISFVISFTAAAYGQVSAKRLVSGLELPVFATQAPGDGDRLFILEKDTGNIRIFDLATESLLEDPFLTVTGLRAGGERGLLGMAFHPDFANNGKFYVYASIRGGSRDHRSHVLEYQVSGAPATSNVADPASRQTVLRFDQPFGNHNGGWIGFDPTASAEDAYLYIATGDGGSANDPENNAQDITNNLLGKMLRIDVDGDDFPDNSNANYAIPPSNPFVGAAGDDEIWAYGLRNPWRNSFDRATGDLWIGDVGQNEIEEIDLLPAGSAGGQNYGWRIMEGTECFRRGDIPCGDPQLELPFYEYTHGPGAFQGNSVTGGYVYRGPLKEFQGHYLFADFEWNNVWSLDPLTAAVAQRNNDFQADAGDATAGIASFAEGNQGELYVIGIGGSIYQLESTSRDARWTGDDPTSGQPGDGLTLDDARNWERDGVADTEFVSGDHLILAGRNLATSSTLRLSALTFESDATLEASRVVLESGNVHVEEDATARLVGASLDSPTNGIDSIRKWGPGHLEMASRVRRGIFVLAEGSATLMENASSVQVEPGAVLDQTGTTEIVVDELMLKSGATLRLGTASLVKTNGTLAGMLDVSLAADFVFPTEGESSSTLLMEFGEGSQVDFQSETVDGLPLGHQGQGRFLTLQTSENIATLALLAYQAIPGDSDGNGTVDFADFLRLSGAFGQAGDWLDGDFTSDGEVQLEDFLLLSGNFGLMSESPVSVPEPATISLGFLLLGLATRVRRRRAS